MSRIPTILLTFILCVHSAAPQNASSDNQFKVINRGTAYKVLWINGGQRLAVASDMGIWSYDAKHLEDQPLQLTPADSIDDMATSVDGSALAWVSGRTEYLMDAATGKQRDLFSVDSIGTESEGIRMTGIRISAQGNAFLSSDTFGHFYVANTSPYNHIKDSGELLDKPYLQAFSPDGSLFGTVHSNGILWISRTDIDQLLPLDINIPRENAASIAFSNDGQWLAVGYRDGTIWLGNPVTWQGHILSTENHAPVAVLTFDSKSDQLAAVNEQGAMTVWNTTNRQRLHDLHLPPVAEITFSPDSDLVVVQPANGDVQVWNIVTGSQLSTLAGARQFSLSPDGKTIAAIHGVTVGLWDVQTGRSIRLLDDYTGSIGAYALSPDDKHLAIAGEDSTVRLLEADTGKSVLTLKGYTGRITEIAFSADQHSLITGGDDATIRLWDVQTGRQIKIFNVSEPVASFAYLGSKQQLVIATKKSLILWDLATGRSKLIASGSYLLTAVNADGQTLGAYTAAGQVELWRLNDLRLLQAFAAYKPDSNDFGQPMLAFSPDDETFAYSKDGESIALYDLQSKQEYSVLQLMGLFQGFTFNRDGSQLAVINMNFNYETFIDAYRRKPGGNLYEHVDDLFFLSFSRITHVLFRSYSNDMLLIIGNGGILDIGQYIR